MLSALGGIAVDVGEHVLHGDDVTIDAVLTSVGLQALHRQLPALTNGEGVLDARPAGYQPVRGDPPSRQRTTVSPLDRRAYLASERRN